MSFPLSFKVKDSLLKFYGKENTTKQKKNFSAFPSPISRRNFGMKNKLKQLELM